MGGLYGLLAPVYDQVFPFDPRAAAFVADSFGLPGSSSLPRRVVDCGCATGSLAIDLAGRGLFVEGIDLDNDLIEIAERKASALQGIGITPSFRLLDMREAAEKYPAGSFGCVACLGNTLPHLPGPTEIGACLSGFRRLLAPGGVLVVQIIDFERLIAAGATGLPTIEAPGLSFQRDYIGLAPGKRFEFRARLILLGEGKTAESSVPLWPLSRSELLSLSAGSGFRDAEFFGGFSGEPAGTGLPLVFRARA